MKRLGVFLALLTAGGVARAAASESQPKHEVCGDAPHAAHRSRRQGGQSRQGGAGERPWLPADWVEALRLALVGADDEAAIEAAATLGRFRGYRRRLSRSARCWRPGAAPARLQAALDALGKLGDAHLLRTDQATLDALELYSGHRAPDIRRRAIKALGTL